MRDVSAATPSAEKQALSTNADRHWLDSSLREKVLEHLFVGELLKHLWRLRRRDFEVLRPEVDRGGYDLVLGCAGHLRHVQLKASHREARAASVKINVALSAVQSGCVIWLMFDPDTLTLRPFYWFGGAPGERLPNLGDRVARHTKANSAGLKTFRPNLRELTKQRFERLESIEAVAARLFGL